MSARTFNAGADSPAIERGRFHGSPGVESARIFDPFLPLEMHQYLAEIVQDTGEVVCVPMVWTPAIHVAEQEYGWWKCVLKSDELAENLKQMREVGKLPLSGPYAEVVQTYLGELELALSVRLRGSVNVRGSDSPSAGGRL